MRMLVAGEAQNAGLMVDRFHGPAIFPGVNDAEGKLRARALRQRKEALRYSVERLELQVLQKERELRKRLESA